MATNLRLRPEAERALRDLAASTGRSQQDLMREALDKALGLVPGNQESRNAHAAARGRGDLIPPRRPFREMTHRASLPAGVGSGEFLDRADRV